MTSRHIVGIIAVVVSGLSAVVGAQRPTTDWPQWRGPNRDGALQSFTAPATWPEGLTMKWKAEVGLGYSTPIVIGNRVFMFSRRDQDEVLAAFDAMTGKELWHTNYAAPYDLVKAAAPHGMGPKATPVYADGKLFTFGISGILSAFDASNGKLLWQKAAPAVGPTFSTSQSPIVDRGLVIAHVGGNNKGALTAFDVNTGAIKWQWTGDGPGYGSPIITEFGGVRQVVTFTQQNLVGVSAETGELLWQRPFKTPNEINALTPLVYGGTLIVSGQDQGVQALRIVRKGEQWTVEDVWRNDEMWFRLSNGIVVRDAVFGLATQNSGHYFFVDAKTGKTLWKGEPRAAANAAIMKSGDLLFVLEDDGELVVGSGANPTSFSPTRRYKVAEQATWAQPAISGNRVFVKDLTTLALWRLN
jgi:outer membrane protein assembly factor BamB